MIFAVGLKINLLLPSGKYAICQMILIWYDAGNIVIQRIALEYINIDVFKELAYWLS